MYLLSNPGHYYQAANDRQEVLKRRETDEYYITEIHTHTKKGTQCNSYSAVCITALFPVAVSSTWAKSADYLHNRGGKGKSHYTNWGWLDSKIKLYVSRSLSLFEYWRELGRIESHSAHLHINEKKVDQTKDQSTKASSNVNHAICTVSTKRGPRWHVCWIDLRWCMWKEPFKWWQTSGRTILGFSSLRAKRRFHQPRTRRCVLTRLLQISWKRCCCSVVLEHTHTQIT